MRPSASEKIVMKCKAALFPPFGAILAGCLFLTSCANQLRPPLAPQAAYVEMLKKRYASAASDAAETLDAHTAAKRNKIMNELIFLVNDYYDRYELRWYSTNAGVASLSDITNLGLDLGSAAAGGNSLKTLLSTLSAAVGGAKLSLEKDILQSQSIILIIRTMRETRRAKYEYLRAKMADAIHDYPLEEALIDIQEYWHAGTVIGALQKLHNQATFQNALESETDLQIGRAHQVKVMREALDAEKSGESFPKTHFARTRTGATTETERDFKPASKPADTRTDHQIQQELIAKISALPETTVTALVTEFKDGHPIGESPPPVQLQLIIALTQQRSVLLDIERKMSP